MLLKSWIYFIFFFYTSEPAYTLLELKQKYTIAYQNKDYKTSLLFLKKYERKCKYNDSNFYYDYAYIASLAGQISTSKKYMLKSIEKGWYNKEHILKDEDLQNLRNSIHWPKIMNKLEDRLALIDTSIVYRIDSMMTKDRDLRIQWEYYESINDSLQVIKIRREVNQLDSLNAPIIWAIIHHPKMQGMINKNILGEASNKLTTLIQHLPKDKFIQLEKIITQSYYKGYISSHSYARYIDRKNLYLQKPILYGTNYLIDTKNNCAYFPQNENRTEMDKNRASIALKSIDDMLIAEKIIFCP